jgi:hypothetical protein
MKPYGGGCIDPHFLGLGRFIPGGRAPATHWIGGWVDPRADSTDLEKRKYLILPGLKLRLLGRPARR